MAFFSYCALGIIVHPQGDQILLVHEQEGWRLPSVTWETSSYTHWTDVTWLNPEMSRWVGGELMTLRCLSNTYDVESNGFSRVYVMELQPSVWVVPALAMWTSMSELPSIVPSEHRLKVEQWLTGWNTLSAQSPVVPWYHLEWFARITNWVEQQVKKDGGRVIDVPEQLRVGERGSLLCVKTTLGRVYCKALPAFFAHEISLLEYLTPRYPSFLPTLVAVDTRSQVVLTRDFGGTLLSQSKDLDDFEDALLQYAVLQIDQVEHIQDLRALGCPYLPPEALAASFDSLLAEVSTSLTDIPGGLSEEELLRLYSLRQLLRSMCQQLGESPVPCSLEHGDFYDENIVMTEMHPLYFDWTDSCISHPFFSLYPFLLAIEPKWPHIVSLREHLRNVYLQPWERYTAMEQLVALFELAQQLAPLYLASLYSSIIIPKMEAKWEMQHGVVHNLRVLLERIPSLQKGD